MSPDEKRKANNEIYDAVRHKLSLIDEKLDLIEKNLTECSTQLSGERTIWTRVRTKALQIFAKRV